MTEQVKLWLEQLNSNTITQEEKLKAQEYFKKKYYESGDSELTDEQYDKYFGANDYVGYTVDAQTSPWNVLPHKIAMGSLPKLTTWEQAENWLKTHPNNIWEPKLDGLSMELVYEYGKLVHAILRGGGDAGEDILKNAINFKGVVKSLNTFCKYISVRGEVVIAKSSFDELVKISNEAYSNRRNCVPGICRRYDGQYSNYLSFYAYDIIEQTEDSTKMYETETDKVFALYNYGFKVPFAFNTMTKEDYLKYASLRNDAEDFQMDGLVIKTQDMKEQIALKFPANGETTTVTNYTWEVGSTGKLVPVVHFEKVNVGGTNLTKASVGSFKIYKELNAPIGSTVKVKKMNDVIPKVTETIFKSDRLLEIPTKCPACGSTLVEKGTDLYCVNDSCPVKLEQSCTAVYKAIPLKGITDKWIKELINLQVIKTPADVILVKEEDIARIDGYSLKTGQKIVEHFTEQVNIIFANNDKYLINFLKMIPIPSLGGKAIEKFATIFADIADFETWLYNIDENTINQLKASIGNSAGTKAYEYLTKNKNEIINLIEAMKTKLF